ncbi:multi antimicrobial extrusion protein MatE [Bacillus horti]|uniref:Na+-driven multidrug efflux pump n=1 Tax=Caldalkalibacillus horti TaxID=77523 RepID=A0ABT9W3L0_9BACI|nr:multi antimicrobial extrusion protein MatE [Bacillus horti]MDQ0167659.1 Na+-driven multidrug efflux pump [Bacillus horti]
MKELLEQKEQLRTRTLLLFFIPLGFSASLVTLSHVIINSTLARSEQAEFVIACYAIAMSIFVFTEKSAVLLRQTCSALIKDQKSFHNMFRVTVYVILLLFLVAMTIAYTPLGNWIYLTLFGAGREMVEEIQNTYRILLFVTIFSALRCLYHGIIISNRKTKWLTIGMVIRLLIMYALSLYFLSTGQIDGRTGAIIFLVGMIVECAISAWEGRRLIKELPSERPNQPVATQRNIMIFYYPLVLSTLFTVLIGPSINAFLGNLSDMELAIASYALALSFTQLVLSFFSYTHQIVLNFYRQNARKVMQFSFALGLVPFLLLALLCYTPIGAWGLEHILGLNERLLEATLQCMKVFMIMALVFPYLDFCNGLLMLKGQTRFMIASQATNLTGTILVLIIGVSYLSGWSGSIGALAQSIGFLVELLVILVFFYKNRAALKRKSAQQKAMNKVRHP